MPSPLELAQGDEALLDAVRRSRKLLNRRALVAAAASAVPVPGLDWAVDAALLSRVLPAINEEFGLTPAQLDLLPAHKREQVQKALAMVGSVVVGKFVTRDLIIRMAQMVGKRLTVQQAAKYVPLAGQAISAVMGTPPFAIWARSTSRTASASRWRPSSRCPRLLLPLLVQRRS